MGPSNQNYVFGDSFLSSKYLDPLYLFDRIYEYLRQILHITISQEARNIWNTTLFIFGAFFMTIIIYTVVRLLEIRKKEHEHLHHEILEYAHNKAEYEKRLKEDVGGSKNEHWGKTLNYLFSQHSSDWKLAIIEADTMLDGLLDQLGFRGESLGDKLKSATQETFSQLTTAWEVHTIRNRIAHEGLSFELSHHEAKRVIALYEQIFHAYGYI